METGLRKIKVTPLACESLGVRSMCTFIQTPDITALLDAGVSLCPYRFSLPPHPIEYQTIQHLRQTIAQAAQKATITTVSHYHFDHHTPSFEDWVVNWTQTTQTAQQIYQDKTIIAKHPKNFINTSQRQRAWSFQKTADAHAKSFQFADGNTFEFGNTKLRFSEAVPHGSEDAKLGWVTMATIDYGEERFMFAPDVQGPISKHTTELILAAKPAVLMLGGPPLYLAGFRVEEAQIKSAIQNLTHIVTTVPTVILEHHALRDEAWRPKLEEVFKKAQASDHLLITAAEYAGKENVFLESKRKQLYIEHPVSEKFKQWTKTLTNQKITKPPI